MSEHSVPLMLVIIMERFAVLSPSPSGPHTHACMHPPTPTLPPDIDTDLKSAQNLMRMHTCITPEKKKKKKQPTSTHTHTHHDTALPLIFKTFFLLHEVFFWRNLSFVHDKIMKIFLLMISNEFLGAQVSGSKDKWWRLFAHQVSLLQNANMMRMKG